MRSHRERTNTPRRRALLPGGLLLTGLLVGMLAIAAYAATGTTATPIEKGKAKLDQSLQPGKVFDGSGEAQVAPTSAAPAPATAGTSSSHALAKKAVGGVMTPMAPPSNDDCANATPIPDGPYPMATPVVNISEALPT